MFAGCSPQLLSESTTGSDLRKSEFVHINALRPRSQKIPKNNYTNNKYIVY